MITEEMLTKWIKQGEGLTTDFKRDGILSHTYDLARIMTAFANNKFICEPNGGKLLIGVTDNGSIEGVNYKKQHEESIMNVARDKIHPPIIPKFDKTEIDGKTVYIVTIPKTISIIHELITKDGLIPLIRVGSTIRSPSQNELIQLTETQEKSIEGIEEIKSIKRFGKPSPEFYRRVIITPKNANSTLIEFDDQSFQFLTSLRLQHMNLRSPTLHQNEIHFAHNRESNGIVNDVGLLDNGGNICFKETQYEGKKEEETKWLAARDIIILWSVLNFAKTVFQKYNYLDNIQINYDLSIKHHSILYYKLDWCIEEARPFEGEKVQIQKITNMSTINIFEIIKSIIAEITRSFGIAGKNQDFDNYVSSILKEYFYEDFKN